MDVMVLFTTSININCFSLCPMTVCNEFFKLLICHVFVSRGFVRILTLRVEALTSRFRDVFGAFELLQCHLIQTWIFTFCRTEVARHLFSYQSVM
eukprot:UN14366